MRAHAFEITVNARICFSTRMRVCVHSRRIYSLWHVRVVQPLKTYQSSATELASTLYACTITVIPRLARSYRTAQSFGRCDRRWAAGFIGFPREMNFARSIVPNYAPCLATNYALPFISSSFVSFFSFFITVLTRWRKCCCWLGWFIFFFFKFSLPSNGNYYYTRRAKFPKFILNKFPIYSIGFAISAIFEISMRTHYNFSPVEISFFFINRLFGADVTK